MKKKFFAACLVCLILGWSTVTMAITLDALFSGGSMVVGDKLFSDWELIYQDSTSGPLPDYSLVEVIGLTDQPFNPGLQFDTVDQFSVSGVNTLQVDFGFNVTVLGPLLIKDNSLEMLEFGFDWDGGFIAIDEHVTDSNGIEVAYKSVYIDNAFGGSDLYDSAEFTPQPFIHVEKNILILGDYAEDVVRLNSFSQRFSQIPEPATMVLFGLGLLGVAGVSRRKRQ